MSGWQVIECDPLVIIHLRALAMVSAHNRALNKCPVTLILTLTRQVL